MKILIRFTKKGTESRGLVIGLNVEQGILTLRCVMSWVELLAYVGDVMAADMSFG